MKTSIEMFKKEVQERGGNLYSFILYHRGEVLCEEYYGSNNENKLHRMFSIAKSITAYAILHLISEERLTLEDKIISYFPEFISEKTHEYVKQLTIKNMLMMRTCYSKTTYKLSRNDWVRTFFETEPDHRPGTLFAYDTSSAHVLGALVEKLTGRDPLSYIKEKIPAIGLSKDSYMLKDPDGISMGGSGYVAYTKDLQRIGCFLLDAFILDDENFSKKYSVSAVYRKLIFDACGGDGQKEGLRSATIIRAKSAFESHGYAMMTWRCDHNGFMCYGMGGQFAAVYPDKEVILITTADNQGKPCGNDAVFDSFYKYILPEFEDKKENNETEAEKELIPEGKNLVFFLEQNEQNFTKLEIKNEGGRRFRLQLLGETNYELYFRLQSLKDIIYRKEGESESGIFQYYNQYYDGRGCITDDNTLYLVFDVNDAYLGSVHMMVRLSDDKRCADIFMKKIEESLFHEFKGFYVGNNGQFL